MLRSSLLQLHKCRHIAHLVKMKPFTLAKEEGVFRILARRNGSRMDSGFRRNEGRVCQEFMSAAAAWTDRTILS